MSPRSGRGWRGRLVPATGLDLSQRRLGRRVDRFPARGRPLPPVRGARLPVGAPHADRPQADGAPGRDRRLFVSPLRDERGWEFAGGEYADAVNGFRFLSEAYAIADPGYDARVTVPVLWDTHVGHDRLQRVSGHPADALDGVRAAGRASGRAVPRAAARRDRRAQPRRSTTASTTRSTRPASPPGRRSTSARCAGCSPPWTRSTPGWPTVASSSAPAAGDRLAAVHHARALRRRLPDPLQVLDPQAGRVRAPVAVRPRPLPVAGRRRDRRLRRDPRPLLRHPPDDQSVGPDRDAAGGQLRRAVGGAGRRGHRDDIGGGRRPGRGPSTPGRWRPPLGQLPAARDG